MCESLITIINQPGESWVAKVFNDTHLFIIKENVGFLDWNCPFYVVWLRPNKADLPLCKGEHTRQRGRTRNPR